MPYRVRAIDRQRGEQRQHDFVKLNPAASVPVLVDPDGPDGENVVLAQSGAILVYLAEKAGRFLPAGGAERCMVQQWFLQVLTDVNPAASAYLLMHKAVDANEQTRSYFRQRLTKFLADCSAQLEKTPFLAGEISIADIALYPICVSRNDIVKEAPGLEALRRWMRDMEALPAVARGMAAA